MRPEAEKIAIVDDDDAARHALQFLLDVLGRKTEGFSSAARFLTTGADQFSCLILDQHMSGMTGLELARILKSRGATIPIMLISGDMTTDIAEEAVEVGVEISSQKPPGAALLSHFLENFADPRSSNT